MTSQNPIAPRSPRRADAIFAAALADLAAKGYDAVTIEGVASAAGVNKTTIYRWWKSKDALLSAALRHGELLRLHVPDTGTLRGDLIDSLAQIATLLTAPAVRALLVGVIDGGRPELSRLAQDFAADRLAGHQLIIDRAVRRGELEPIEPETLFHPLIGAVWIRILLLHRDADAAYLTDLVERQLRR